MHLYYRNINDAFAGIVKGFHTGTFSCTTESHTTQCGAGLTPTITRSPSRNGDVLVIEEPVTITYTNPLNRVLRNPVRDTNPFFHVIEAMWMLAGRRDIAPLVHFNKEMAKFSDDGETFHAAYGDRWRNYFGTEDGDLPWAPHDQLDDIIEILSKDKTSRRVVLEMWSNGDLRRQIEYPTAKDLPCNLLAMFRVRQGYRPANPSVAHELPNGHREHYLDMTVVNRSNDMLLGMCGANYVHFSYLQEYIALALGVSVGHYHQITNNLHVYTSPKEEGSPWLPGKCDPVKMLQAQSYYPKDTEVDRLPLYTHREKFDHINREFFEQRMWEYTSAEQFLRPFYPGNPTTDTRYYNKIVIPMVLAFNYHKQRNYKAAHEQAAQIQQTDWRIDCTRWLTAREKMYNRALDDGPLPTQRSTQV